MLTIAIIGQKGGTGKTTICTGLAVAASQDGMASAILDLDPQANAWNWKKRRGLDRDPAVRVTQPAALADDLETLRQVGADIVFIDTPGRSESAALQSARLADLVLIPTQPQVYDMETLASVKGDLLGLARKENRAIVVLNRVRPNSKRAVGEASAAILSHFSLPVAPVSLANRAAYGDAPAAGLSPQELDPDGRASAELGSLFRFVIEAAIALTGEQS